MFSGVECKSKIHSLFTPTVPGYLGCYSAEIYRQIQTGRINTSSVPPIRLNPFSCIESCSQEDYDYAVLAVIGCWCFTLPQGAKIDKVPTGEEYASCHSPCVWSRQYACGGESHIALYLGMLMWTNLAMENLRTWGEIILCFNSVVCFITNNPREEHL